MVGISDILTVMMCLLFWMYYTVLPFGVMNAVTAISSASHRILLNTNRTDTVKSPVYCRLTYAFFRILPKTSFVNISRLCATG